MWSWQRAHSRVSPRNAVPAVCARSETYSRRYSCSTLPPSFVWRWSLLNVVASRVRFRGGHPDKSGYRRFKVRDLEGQDDFAAMEQVVGRSLKRCVRDGELPAKGFLKQEQIALERFLASETGRLYAA